ncbi:hypothetical protein GlitD10_0069 [Gloeomargarita lithophora Alchichica-D10]|uniref:Uncharacterized protein n=1 Tax=Gloeomargarita lithophora Alchichica-D10 TaxID=1188229 RepID=A0A1J0A8V7_9CYAN|nr:DUF6515 family protein [Gloeomargarita lithophora]APB32370.1 hypothetical protein GlitD10_0069 [Gloeomargarita lithophora Alchichica-D10]
MGQWRRVVVISAVGLWVWGVGMPAGYSFDLAQRRGNVSVPRPSNVPASRPAVNRPTSVNRPTTSNVRSINRSQAGDFRQNLDNRGNISRPSTGITRPANQPNLTRPITRPGINQPITRPGERPANINTGNINRDRTNVNIRDRTTINTGDRLTNISRDRNVIGNTVNINRSPSISVQGSAWRGGGWWGGGYNRPPGWGAFAFGTGLVLGAVLSSPPPFYHQVFLGTTPFLFSDGVFLQPTADQQFVVVAPPVGIAVPYLPDGCEPFTFEGSQFFDCSGVFYEPVIQDGQVVFVVVQE